MSTQFLESISECPPAQMEAVSGQKNSCCRASYQWGRVSSREQRSLWQPPTSRWRDQNDFNIHEMFYWNKCSSNVWAWTMRDLLKANSIITNGYKNGNTEFKNVIHQEKQHIYEGNSKLECCNKTTQLSLPASVNQRRISPHTLTCTSNYSSEITSYLMFVN